MLSIALASFNGEHFINAQLDSIILQLAESDEIVISDDASVDGSTACIKARNDPRIHLLENTDRVGYVGNFERAVRHCRGDIIVFSDQDDVWLPHKISRIVGALKNKQCVVSDAIIVDESLRQLHPSYFLWRNAKPYSLWSVYRRPCFIGATLACTRAYLEGVLPFPKSIPHDYWVTLNAMWDEELEVVAEPLILYRRHGSTASVSATSRRRSLFTIVRERALIAGHFLWRRLIRGSRPKRR
jgi:glycosyltransferase involved in cell wall biosynthesis